MWRFDVEVVDHGDASPMAQASHAERDENKARSGSCGGDGECDMSSSRWWCRSEQYVVGVR